MAIKGVLLDVDGVVLAGAKRPSEEWSALDKGLSDRGLLVGLMTSDAYDTVSSSLEAANIRYDSLHSTQVTGKAKPGGSLVESFCTQHGLQPNETLVLGKDERSVLEAMNGRSLGFHAHGAGNSRYGIRIDNARQFFEYMDIFFRKEHLWYARFDGFDGRGKGVHVRALIDGNGAGSATLKTLLYRTLKERTDSEYRGFSLSKFLMLHLLASAFLDGFLSLDRNQVYWQIYPGHSPKSDPPPVVAAILRGLTLFRSKMASLRRHKIATRSHTSRVAGDTVGINLANQLRTLVLGKTPTVHGRRVFVLDDFTTEGYSHEAARAFFYAAGATDVFSLAVGNYGSRYRIQTPRTKNALKFNPYSANQLNDDDFSVKVEHLSLDADALGEFRQSARALSDAEILAHLYPE